MKNAIIVTLVILIIGGFYFINDSGSDIKVEPTPKTSEGRPDLSNATFIFEEESITLEKGKNERRIVEDSDIKEETTITDFIAYGDLNNDNKEDAAAIIVQSGGGSGVFVYVAGYISGTVRYKGTNAILLGDRVNPQDISIKNGVINVNYLDRNPDEALASEPTVSVSKQFTYKNQELQEK